MNNETESTETEVATSPLEISLINISIMCHEANKLWCELNGDNYIVPWGDTPEEYKKSITEGVLFCIDNPDASVMDVFNSWIKQPSLKVDYLTETQQRRYAIFKATVGALSSDVENDTQVGNAMETLKAEMQDVEPGSLAYSWFCNLKWEIHDRCTDEKISKKKALKISNDAASDFMKRLFDIEIKG